VKIDFWDENSPYPTGHYVRTIGDVNDRAIESEVILLEHSIPSEPFTPAVIACLPPKNWTITAENTASDRVDLRHLAVCSIDPPGCKDIDDALHARMLPSGHLEVGVRIPHCNHTDKIVEYTSNTGTHRGRFVLRPTQHSTRHGGRTSCHNNISVSASFGHASWIAHGDVVFGEIQCRSFRV